MDWPRQLKNAEEEAAGLAWGEPILIGVLPGEAVQWTATAFRGPEDEVDLEANGDPFSLTGEEDEEGYDAGEGDGYEEFLDEDDQEDEAEGDPDDL